MHRPLGGLDRQPVHYLQRARHESGAHHVRHRLARLARVVEERDQRPQRLRLRNHTKGDPRRDAERALGPHERPDQVVARRVEPLAAELHDLAVGEHDLQAGHVVRREPVLEAVGAARVLGHIAAD